MKCIDDDELVGKHRRAAHFHKPPSDSAVEEAWKWFSQCHEVDCPLHMMGEGCESEIEPGVGCECATKPGIATLRAHDAAQRGEIERLEWKQEQFETDLLEAFPTYYDDGPETNLFQVAQFVCTERNALKVDMSRVLSLANDMAESLKKSYPKCGLRGDLQNRLFFANRCWRERAGK